MVNIIVPIKDIVNLTEIKVDPSTQRPILAGLSRKISDVDKRALEAAVQLKEKHGGKVTIVSMGDDKTKTALREALAIGGDEAFLLKDPIFEGSDTLTTARILASAIRKLGDYNLILCGEMTLDSLSAQIGPRLSELLGLPQATYTRKLELKGETLVAERDLEDEDEVVEVSMPALVTVTREINEPRIPALMNIMKASRKPIQEWNAAALGLSANEVGTAGSAVKVLEVKAPPMERKRIIIKAESEEEAAKSLVERLIKDGVLK